MKPAKRLSIAIPSSLVADTADQKIRTYKIGQIARACAIHRVDEIVIYRAERDESKFIEKVLEYMETPQYLRKYLFPLIPELKSIGVVPPLQTPHHPTEKTRYRDGYTLSEDMVDVGYEKPVRLKQKVKKGRRITIDMEKLKIIDKSEVPHYWGYEVRIEDSLSSLLKSSDYKIATSRFGDEKIPRGINAPRLMLIFGSPYMGIHEILEQEKSEKKPDEWWNAIPAQGTKTVRTEEAVLITLGIVNSIRRQIYGKKT
ncbi:MAG: putative RNA uridine N3 methyltransferase [Candidatus Hydrothermarchaeota archaeon]